MPPTSRSDRSRSSTSAAPRPKILRRNHARIITIGAFPIAGALPSEVLAQVMPELDAIRASLRALDTLRAREIVRAARTEEPISIMMVDVDHFKQINDIHGHAAGDVVLRDVARRLKDHLRECDLLGRYGGEEFQIMLSGCAAEDALAVGARLRTGFSRASFLVGGAAISLTCSFGVASCTVDDAFARSDPDGEILVAAADAALYRAKRSGRNRVVLGSSLVTSQPAGRQSRMSVRSARPSVATVEGETLSA